MATKTSAAGEATTTAFHIATAEETIAEANRNSTYNVPTGIASSSTDGYTACAIGTQWNMFGWGDVTGLKTSRTYADYNPDTSISGNAVYDIARAQLGGSWRLPTCASVSTGNEFAAFMDKTFGSLPPDGENWMNGATYLGRQYTYTLEDENAIANTLNLSAAGRRMETSIQFLSGVQGYYRSGSFGNSVSDGYYYLNFQKDEAGISLGNAVRYYGMSVRPVTE